MVPISTSVGTFLPKFRNIDEFAASKPGTIGISSRTKNQIGIFHLCLALHDRLSSVTPRIQTEVLVQYCEYQDHLPRLLRPAQHQRTVEEHRNIDNPRSVPILG